MTTAVPAPEPIDGWAAGGTSDQIWLNASAVDIDGRGIAILGASGTGKSALALALVALGAALIADDGLWLTVTQDPPRLVRPDQSPDLIEARGVGLIRVGSISGRAPLNLVVDLDRTEPHRLPPRRLVAVGKMQCPLILGVGQPTLAPALMLMARHGRAEI